MVADGRIREIRLTLSAFGERVEVVLPDGSTVPPSVALQQVGGRRRGAQAPGPRHTPPQKSLERGDFEAGVTPAQFAARVAAVSQKLGDTNLRGRIASVPTLRREGTETFEEWWQVATVSQKLRLLTDGGRFASMTADPLAETYLREEDAEEKFAGVPAPFQGALRPQAAPAAEVEAPEQGPAPQGAGHA